MCRGLAECLLLQYAHISMLESLKYGNYITIISMYNMTNHNIELGRAVSWGRITVKDCMVINYFYKC